MKKISLVLFIVSTFFISCDKYEEERGPVFDGTWTLIESYVISDDTTVKNPIHRAKFLIAREFEGEKLLLFYSGGYYDSSFFFRIQDDKIFVRRVLDSVDVIFSYYLKKSDGSDSLDNSGNKILKIDTLKQAQKPLHPETYPSPEEYYGTCSFNNEKELKLTIDRYTVDKDGAPTGKLYGRDIYVRPEEKE